MPVILSGLSDIAKQLNKEIHVIEKNSLNGLIEASIIVRRAMEKENPKVPAKYSNLRASWFVTTPKRIVTGNTATFVGKESAEMGSDHTKVMLEAQSEISKEQNPVLIMGFSANYAVWVHEMVEPINWSRPGSGAKFFETALNTKKKDMLKAIEGSCKIK